MLDTPSSLTKKSEDQIFEGGLKTHHQLPGYKQSLC